MYSQPLLGVAPKGVERPHTDVAWTFFYAIVMIVAGAGGIYGVWGRLVMLSMGLVFGAFCPSSANGICDEAGRNPANAKLADPDFLSDAKSCPVHVNGTRLAIEVPGDETFDFGEFFHMAKWWILGSALGSILVAAIFMYLFKTASGIILKLTVTFQVIVPVALGIAGICASQYHPAGSDPSRGPSLLAGVMLLAVGLLVGLIYYLMHHQLRLCSRLLSESVRGISANKGLVPLSLFVQLAVLLLAVPMLLLMLIAVTNGDVVPNPSRQDGSGSWIQPDASGQCWSAGGQKVPCCSWQLHSWVPWYLAHATLALLWTVQLARLVWVYVISGTIADWYFAEPGTASRGVIMKSLGNALTSSFGSLAVGSLVLAAINLMRVALNRIPGCLTRFFRMITTFATVQMAITGADFFDSCAGVTDLLERNLLSTVSVWFLPQFVLRSCVAVLSMVWAVVSYETALMSWNDHPNAVSEAIVLAIISYLLCSVFLSFFSEIMLAVVDTVYVCFCIDLDSSEVHDADVHAVISALPPVQKGRAVINPGGDLSYGRIEEGSA